jgi:hypothetical protein
MPIYKAPTRDTRFVINEVLKIEQYADLPSFETASADMVETVVEECGKFAAEVLAPLNLSGDQQGCTPSCGRFSDYPGRVQTGFRSLSRGGLGHACRA